MRKKIWCLGTRLMSSLLESSLASYKSKSKERKLGVWSQYNHSELLPRSTVMLLDADISTKHYLLSKETRAILVSQARPTSAREGKVWWTVYTSHASSHCTVWSNHVAVFCHMIHYIIVWMAVLKNSERELGHLSCYCRDSKNTSRIV